MITSLEIVDFKCFNHLLLRFGKLTLLTGHNGGGKSSAIQPLLLIAQNVARSDVPELFALNGPLVRLGTAGDVIPSNAERPLMEFKVAAGSEEAEWVLEARAGERLMILATPDPPSAPGREAVSRALHGLTFISAVREGSADAYPIPDAQTAEYDGVGVDGRFAAYWYDQYVDNEVAERRRHPDEEATSLRKQLDTWLGALFPGAQADVQMLPQVSRLSLQFRLSAIGAWRRPANIGYGLTYAFPILVALLVAKHGQIVVIDSPEAHLHPYAQSQMGRLLVHFAAAGVQIIVETHSDHLLNGARLAVRAGTLSHEDMQIHFFTGVTGADHGVISPVVDETGGIDQWPNGFFDQAERDYTQLAGWS